MEHEQIQNIVDEIRSYLEYASRQFYWDLSYISPCVVQKRTEEKVNNLSVLEESLTKLKVEVEKCTRCSLYKTRNRVVFGDGNPSAELMFIGEAPGEEENAQGLPFVGRAGKLLTDIITAMGLRRTDVYIANAVKCWPPKNQTPGEEEIRLCNSYLIRQIELIKPRLIVALGAVSLRALFKRKLSIFNLRGRFIDYKGIKVMPTFHPGFLLRWPEYKRLTWKDIKLVMKELNLTRLGVRRM